jgi:hypothetical protein
MPRHLLWALLSALVACDPDNPCGDPSYYADHGMCLRVVHPADGGADDDAGPDAARPDTEFGAPCTTSADCGGRAPVCGAPMLPVCTVTNCLEKNLACPPTWTCFDVSAWTTDPEVQSVCVRLE